MTFGPQDLEEVQALESRFRVSEADLHESLARMHHAATRMRGDFLPDVDPAIERLRDFREAVGRTGDAVEEVIAVLSEIGRRGRQHGLIPPAKENPSA